MDWEECYQQREIPWDLGGPAPPLLDLLEHRPAAIWGDGVVLVPGCGRGHDAAALHASGREVLGLDLAPSALAEAVSLYGQSDRLRWLEGSFFDPDLCAAYRVGGIFEHTCFCAIIPEDRAGYVEAAARWLAPGGRLIGVFFLDPRKREDGAAGPPFGASREEIRSLFSLHFNLGWEGPPGRAHAEREGREWVVEMVRKH